MSKDPLPLTSEQPMKEPGKELKIANEKTLLFEAIVNVLRDDFGIAIPKKYLGNSLSTKKALNKYQQDLSLFWLLTSCILSRNRRDQIWQSKNDHVLEWLTEIGLRQSKIRTRKLQYLLREKKSKPVVSS